MSKTIKEVTIADGATLSGAVDLRQFMIAAMRCDSAVTVDVKTSIQRDGTYKTADTALQALVLGDDWLNVEPLESLNLQQTKIEASAAVSGDTVIQLAVVAL